MLIALQLPSFAATFLQGLHMTLAMSCGVTNPYYGHKLLTFISHADTVKMILVKAQVLKTIKISPFDPHLKMGATGGKIFVLNTHTA